MKKKQFHLFACAAILTLFLQTSCETDAYDKGEGRYSLMQAELADLTINGQRQGTAFDTDEGDHYTLNPAVTASWIQKSDTTYRVLIYFNKLTDTTAEQVALGIVPTLRPVEHWRLEEQPTDPVGFESAWLSRNGKYINIGLLLKTGQEDGNDGVHAVGLAQDTILTNDDATRTAYYRLLHDQSGVPEYYTNRRYISIVVPQTEKPDSICVSINTYDDTVERRFSLQ